VETEAKAMDVKTTPSRYNLAQSRTTWLIVLPLFVVVMGLTICKDWWLTRDTPNIWFYVVVPPLSLLGGILSTLGIARALKQPLTFLESSMVIVGVNTVMQVAENVLKLVYHLVWQYPGILYLAVVFPLALALALYGYVRWTGAKWRFALVYAIIELVGEMIAGGLLTSIPGLDTPGS
jgi:hypothetical protein